MHSVLASPELLERILSFHGAGENARYALVCRAWVEPARATIWHKVDKPCALLKLLGAPECTVRQREHRMPLPLAHNVQRFNEIAVHVRVLCLGKGPKYCIGSITDAMSQVNSACNMPLLPGLRVLDAASMELSPGGEIPFLCHKLRHLTIQLPSSRSGRTLVNSINDAVFRASGISSLAVVASYLTRPSALQFEQVLMTLPATFSRLCTLSLPLYFLTPNLFARLATTSLTDILFSTCARSHDNRGDPRDVLLGPFTHHDVLSVGTPFAQLTQLALCTDLANLIPVLNNNRFPVHNLVLIVIRAARQPAHADIHALCTILAQRGGGLRTVCMHLAPPRNSRNDTWPAPDQSERLTLGDVFPLCSITGLRRLVLTHARSLGILDTGIDLFCASLPRLETLVLNPSPATDDSPFLTLSSLSVVARHCPLIRILALHVDATANIPPPTHSPITFAHLETLDLLSSRLCPETRRTVALFLASILPEPICMSNGGYDSLDEAQPEHQYREEWTSLQESISFMSTQRLQLAMLSGLAAQT
ncbi:hypothetical protein PENSPDRAFT_695330 [Peniophora sp. CONT]|nr:hypothetical protein PENSPDRAFT_695330 [Peniophora sp. CONT]